MKNRIFLSLSAGALLLLVLSACNDVVDEALQNNSAQSSAVQSDDNALQVVTTFVPMTQFTRAVAGDRAVIIQLLPPNVDPHNYQASPVDIRRLAEADVLIENGLGLESFLSDLIKNADNDDLKVVDSSEGVEISVDVSVDETGESKEGEVSGDERSDLDPHVWLDPKKAIGQVENIRDGLIVADPAGSAVYTANAAAFIDELESLDQFIRESLAPYAGKTFVTFHNYAGYFADSYGLEVVYLVNLPEDNAAPADVQRVIEVAEKNGLKTLLSEPQQSTGALDAIAADLGIQVSVFDPIETSNVAIPGPEDYIETMEQNLANLTAALSAATP